MSVDSTLVNEILHIPSWEARYEKIIAIGKMLPALPEQYRNDNYKVKGCQSQVWLWAYKDDSDNVHFQADSDALIVKGLIALLLSIYSGKKSKDILATPLDFVKELGFDTHLSPSRANGLYAIIKQIKYYALVLGH